MKTDKSFESLAEEAIKRRVAGKEQLIYRVPAQLENQIKPSLDHWRLFDDWSDFVFFVTCEMTTPDDEGFCELKFDIERRKPGHWNIDGCRQLYQPWEPPTLPI